MHGNTIVSMEAKCGSIDCTLRVFQLLAKQFMTENTMDGTNGGQCTLLPDSFSVLFSAKSVPNTIRVAFSDYSLFCKALKVGSKVWTQALYKEKRASEGELVCCRMEESTREFSSGEETTYLATTCTFPC